MPEHYQQAARRHFADAERLARDKRWENASHLLGFAAECALKHLLTDLRPKEQVPHTHLPVLADTAKKHLKGRRHQALLRVIESPTYFDGWTVDQRYHPDGSVTADQYTSWLSDARRTLGALR